MNKKVLYNTVFSVIDKFMHLFCNLLIGIIVARYLGKVGYGNYSFFVVVCTFTSAFSAFGMQNIITKDFACKENQRLVLTSALIIAVVASIFTSCGILIIGRWFRALTMYETMYAIILCTLNIGAIFQYYLIAHYHFQSMAILNSIFLLGILGLYYYLYKINADFYWFEFAFVLKEGIQFVVAILLFLIFKKSHNRESFFSGNALLSQIKNYLSICFPLLLSGLSVSIYLKADQLMIKNMLNESELGIYSAGIKIVEIFFVIPTAVISGVLPFFSKLYNEDNEKFWVRYEQLACALNALSYLFIIVMIPLNKYIITLLFGEEFIAASQIQRVYVWSCVFVAMGCVRGIYLSIKEYSKTSFAFSVISALLNVLLNYLLIPCMGIVGAAYASVISYALQSFIFTFFSPKLRKMLIVQIRSLYRFVFHIKEYAYILKICMKGKLNYEENI